MGRRPLISRDEVLQAARAAFAERGFDGTTLASIAKRLGVSAAARLHGVPAILRVPPSRRAGLRSSPPAGALHRFVARDLDARRLTARAQEEGKMKPRIVVILLLIAAGAAGYWTWQRQHAAAPLVLSGSIETRQVRVGSLVAGRVAAVHTEE